MNVHKRDRETLPLHKQVITFDAVPPGHEPKIINPRLISNGNLKIRDIINARKGMTVNWIEIVIIIHLNFLRV